MTFDGEVQGPPRWARALLVAIVVLPVLVAVVRALHRDWFPVGDSALLYIRARDVLTAHHPLLGSWTSASLSVGEHMNNPGPLYADLVAPVARLLPFSAAAAVGVGLVNAASIVGISAASRKVAGWAMQRWMLLACAVLAWVMGSELLIDIWQAHALLLPFLFFVVLAVGMALGRRWCVPWSAAIATLLVQTHVSYVYVLGVVTATALIVFVATNWPLAWGRWRDVARSRSTVATAIVVIVLWAQPLWEQLFGPGRGNLTRLATNASGGDVRVGLDDGVRVGARILVQPPWRLRSGFSTLIPNTGVIETTEGTTFSFAGIPTVVTATATLAGMVVLLVGLGWAAHRRQLAASATACWIAVGGVVGAPVCLALVTVGEVGFAQHHVRWMWTFAVFAGVVILWTACDLVADRWPTPALSSAGNLLPLALTSLAALAAVPYHAQQQGPVADYAAMPALHRVFRDLEPLDAGEPLAYDTRSLRVYEPYSSAVLMRLQELGIDFRVTDDGMVRQLGNRRRADGTEPTRVFQLEGVDALLYEGPGCRVTGVSALEPQEEGTAAEAADDLVAALTTGALVVDIAAVPDGDSAGLAAAAASGDERAARRLVYDGRLGAWIAAGVAAPLSNPSPDWAAAAADVGAWVDTTYALFAVNPRLCETLS